jgi:NADH:ubiquinone oxidoreductase subunit 4 (subunit M)
MNSSIIGLFSGEEVRSVMGSVLSSIGHSIISAGMFMIVGCIYKRV